MKSTMRKSVHSVLLTGKCSPYRCIGIIVGLLAFLSGCSNGENQAPKDSAIVVGGARCPEPTWFVGSIDPQKQRELTHTFTIQNQTNKSLPIEKIKPDCGCIVPEDNPRAIPAGGSVEIKVRLKASPAPGQFQHMVQVKFGPAESASLFLKIRGAIVPTAALHAEPSSLDFGRLSDKEPSTRTICVSRYDFSSVRISKLSSNIEGCTFEEKQATQGQTIIVTVRFGGERLKPGPHSGFVFVETDHPTYSKLQIPVTFEVGAIADAFVSSVFIDSISPGAHKSFSLFKPGLPETALPKITRFVYKGNPDIQIASPSSKGSGDALQLWQLSVSRHAKVGTVKKGVLRIGTSDSPSDDVEVPVLVFVK